ncbi:MAG: prepilin-type N-terminal cleavage/methylation domain-containing protein [Eubacteriales bacterium]|nr:prepilin-type N-terminal cleavage/methylation domain-containing protein [Eubacteriales bacterium]
MKKKLNKGFTMVEILVSLAIFSILMIPIVSGIVTALKSSTKSKEIQYRNELAQNLLEYTKEDELENVLDLGYFKEIGSYDVEKTTEAPKQADVTYTDPSTGKEEIAYYDTYEIAGSMNLGTNNKKYSYKVQVSSLDYAKRMAGKEVSDLRGSSTPVSSTPGLYEDPNNMKLGIVEDLDYTKLALINGTIANYDAAVTDAFITRKLQILKEKNRDLFEQYVNQAYEFNPFARDKVKRNIIISVSGKKADGYKVQCKLEYIDDSVYRLPSGNTMANELASRGENIIEYTPYTNSFEELPNIYLMYNVCLYNGFYSDNDYIIVDTSGLEIEDKVEISNGIGNSLYEINTTIPVNLFIVETASQFSTGVADQLTDIETKQKEALLANEGKSLTDKEKAKIYDAYHNRILYDDRNTATGDNRDNVNVCIAAKAGCSANNKLANVHIYHNFSKSPTDKDGNSIKNTTNANFKYVDYSTLPRIGGVANSCEYIYTRRPVDSKRDEKLSASFDALNKAKQNTRGLYTVKVWVAEGDKDQVDTTKEPLITGTKGGSAFE